MVYINNIFYIPLLGITGMVSSDSGLPDPDNPDGDLRVPNEDVILVTDEDEDSDHEQVLFNEYQPLPADEAAADSNHGYESSEDEASGHHHPNESAPDGSIPPITPMEDALVKEVWSVPPPKVVDIEMDSKKVNEVKEVMANITLPPSSIPEWASNIPEEEWKNQLMKRLQNLHSDKK